MDALNTREDFVALMMTYLDPLRAHYSEGGARLRTGVTGAHYDRAAAEMEAWARPLWALAPFWAGGGHDAFFEDVYLRGLIAGTDPANPEYWGDAGRRNQRLVEMPAIAYALILAPHILWEPLTDVQRAQVASWLSQINEQECCPNNWQFFPVLVNTALKRLGMPYRADVVAQSLELLDSYYAGYGWYHDGDADGQNGIRDYYNAMAFHFYGPFFALYGAELDPAGNADRFLDRAREFAADFIHLFSARGEAVPFGRSLTYRFAQCAFFSFAAAHGLDLGADITPAVMKGIVARNLAFWAAQPTRDNGGVLTIGYHYPQPLMSEGYNAFGSPNWAAKALALLALPADDPFWALPAAPLPFGDGVRVLAGPDAGLLVQNRDGEVTLYAGGHEPNKMGSSTYEAKYSKFCYSSRYGFSVARSDRFLAEAVPDSMLAFVVDGRVYTRGQVPWEDIACEDGTMVSRWSPYPGIQVESRITPTAQGHARVHHVTSKIACEAYDCGFAVPCDVFPGDDEAGLDAVAGMCRVTCADAASAVPGERHLLICEPNTNLMNPSTCIPCVRYDIPEGESYLATDVSEGPCPAGR